MKHYKTNRGTARNTKLARGLSETFEKQESITERDKRIGFMAPLYNGVSHPLLKTFCLEQLNQIERVKRNRKLNTADSLGRLRVRGTSDRLIGVKYFIKRITVKCGCTGVETHKYVLNDMGKRRLKRLKEEKIYSNGLK